MKTKNKEKMAMKTNKLILGVVAAIVLFLPTVGDSSAGEGAKHIVLSKDNTLSLSGEITAFSVADLIEKAKKLCSNRGVFQKNKSLHLFVNSPGGEIQSGLEGIDALNGLNCHVDTITMFAASMAFQTVQNLGTRYILKNGVLMSHRASGGVDGQLGGQHPSQLENRLNFWEERLDEMDEQTVKRTNGKQTLESYQKAYASEMWRTGSRSVKEGYADSVVTVSCDSTLNGVTHHTADLMGLEIHYDLSLCPMVTGPLNIRVSMPTNNGFVDSEEFIHTGGGFGEGCLMRPQTVLKQLCALDTSLNPAKIEEIKTIFVTKFQNDMKRVVDYK